MKMMKVLAAGSIAALTLTACAPGQQQSWGGQQQPYGYGNQPAQNPMTSVLGNAAGMILINILTGQLGINQAQAMGGAGSLFLAAQQRMAPNDFNRLSSAVPDMDRYLAAAPRLSGGYQQQPGALGGMMSVANSFQQLGMGPEMVGRFVPVMLQYVQQQGGAGTMSLLQNALY